MTLQEIEARKAELLNKIAEAKTQEEIAELRNEVEAINKEVPEQEEKEQEEKKDDSNFNNGKRSRSQDPRRERGLLLRQAPDAF